MIDPNQEFEFHVRYVMHRAAGVSRETAIEAVRKASPDLAAQCTGLAGPHPIPFGSRPATDLPGQYEAAVIEKIKAGATPERAHVLVKAENAGLHNAYCGCLEAARTAAEHVARVSQPKSTTSGTVDDPTWLEWVAHCQANPVADP
jgi:hypothetical protein